MLAQVKSCAVVGLDGVVVEVEVDMSSGLPALNIVGLPDTAVQEARERVRAAIRNSGCEFPLRRITVNLAPADLKKEGPSYDLPIAVGIIMSSEQAVFQTSRCLFLGELSLDGTLRPTSGVLAMVAAARQQGLDTVYLPSANAREAALVSGLTILPVDTLSQLLAHMRGELEIAPYAAEPPQPIPEAASLAEVDISHVKGQEHAKRALEVAASGGHNLLLSGPPGSGKTLLARALPTILPRLTDEEALEVTRIYSVAGLLPSESPLITLRPYRSPHYTISHAGLVGGGRIPRPGEVTLSHRGVLFLDELPEFDHVALESLRQPMEDKTVTISRAQGTFTYPCNFMLVAAMNPCPCGYYGDPQKACTCPASLVAKYQKRISGPLLDRIDMFVEVPRVEYEKLVEVSSGETSAQVRARVERAREVQRRRFQGTGISANAEMGPAMVWEQCKLEDGARGILQTAMKQLTLTARGFHRVLKLSRTIADLAGSETITVAHLAEALQYRPRGQV